MHMFLAFLVNGISSVQIQIKGSYEQTIFLDIFSSKLKISVDTR